MKVVALAVCLGLCAACHPGTRLCASHRIGYAFLTEDRTKVVFLADFDGAAGTLEEAELASRTTRRVADGVLWPDDRPPTDIGYLGAFEFQDSAFLDRRPAPSVLSTADGGTLLFLRQASQEHDGDVSRTHRGAWSTATLFVGGPGRPAARLAADVEPDGFHFMASGDVLVVRPRVPVPPSMAYRDWGLFLAPSDGGTEVRLSAAWPRGDIWPERDSKGWIPVEEKGEGGWVDWRLRWMRADGTSGRVAEHVGQWRRVDGGYLVVADEQAGRYVPPGHGVPAGNQPETGTLYHIDDVGSAVRLANDVEEFDPSPDGARIAILTDFRWGPEGVVSDRVGVLAILDSTQGTRHEVAGDVDRFGFSPDGRRLYYQRVEGSGTDVDLVDVDGGALVTEVRDASLDEWRPMLSPAGDAALLSSHPRVAQPRVLLFDGRLVTASGSADSLLERFSAEGNDLYFAPRNTADGCVSLQELALDGGLVEPIGASSPFKDPAARRALFLADPWTPLEPVGTAVGETSGTTHRRVTPVPSLSPDGKAIFWFEPEVAAAPRKETFLVDPRTRPREIPPPEPGGFVQELPLQRTLWVERAGQPARPVMDGVVGAAWGEGDRLVAIHDDPAHPKDDGLWVFDVN